jgi:hypothetical protein
MINNNQVKVFGLGKEFTISKEDNQKLLSGANINDILAKYQVDDFNKEFDMNFENVDFEKISKIDIDKFQEDMRQIQEELSRIKFSDLVRKYPASKVMRLTNSSLSLLRDEKRRISTKNTKEENMNIIINHFRKNKKRYTKMAVRALVAALFISGNAASSFACMATDTATNSLIEISESMYQDIIKISKNFAYGTIFAVTAIRLVSEYSKGSSSYKITAIFKQACLIFLAVLLLPKIPGFIDANILKYLKK